MKFKLIYKYINFNGHTFKLLSLNVVILRTLLSFKSFNVIIVHILF